jgi:hypothetical protein
MTYRGFLIAVFVSLGLATYADATTCWGAAGEDDPPSRAICVGDRVHTRDGNKEVAAKVMSIENGVFMLKWGRRLDHSLRWNKAKNVTTGKRNFSELSRETRDPAMKALYKTGVHFRGKLSGLHKGGVIKRVYENGRIEIRSWRHAALFRNLNELGLPTQSADGIKTADLAWIRTRHGTALGTVLQVYTDGSLFMRYAAHFSTMGGKRYEVWRTTKQVKL